MGFAYNPPTITVPAGSTVTWINQDSVDHAVTSDTPGIFDNPILAGATVRITFTVPGTFNYHCQPHPYMTGIVIVQ